MKKQIIRICPGCGGHFNARRNENITTNCSVFCSNRVSGYKHRHGGSLDGFVQIAACGTARWKELHDPKKLAAERMAKRDAEYAAHAPKVTVEERVKPSGSVVVIETRGQRCIGFRAVDRVEHS